MTAEEVSIVRVRNPKSGGAFIVYSVHLGETNGPMIGSYSDHAGFEPSHDGRRLVGVPAPEEKHTLRERWMAVRRAVATQVALGAGGVSRHRFTIR